MADYPDFEKVCGYGSVTGIGGANCRHSYWPFIEGVSERTYTDAELEAMKPENRPKIQFEGREYDDYQAMQKQRQIERAIRKQKRLKIAFEDAGLTGEAQSASIRLRRLNEKYRQFSKAAGLPEQRERMKVQYVDDASKETAEKLLEKRVQSGILKETGGTLHEITEEAIRRVPKVVPEGWSSQRAGALQEAHRDLLRFVKDQPVGTEAGAIYSPDMKLLERRMGAAHEIRMPHYSGEHILIHNHPDGLIFSGADIGKFILSRSMEILTAIGNDGTLYVIQKTLMYDGFMARQQYLGLKEILQECVKAGNMDRYISTIEDFLIGGSAYGLKFIKSRT